MALRDGDVEKLRAAVAEDTFDGRFELVGEAGAGGMGRVFEAIDRETGTRVALKLVADNADRERFRAEAEILERLAHPAIVRYVRHGLTTRGEPYLAMEWLAGESLSRRLERGPLSFLDAATVGERIAGALVHAHAAGIVHRDLKPSNIFLVDGRPDRACLIDFGIAKRADRDLTRTGQLVGTPGYMAPEQVRGERGLDGRVDLFALGCVLYEALSARRPFEGAEMMEVLARLLLESPPPLEHTAARVPTRLARLVHALLAKDAERRIGDAAIVRDELAEIRAALASGDSAALAKLPPAIPTPPVEGAPTVDERPPPARARRRRRAGPVIAAGVAAIALAGAAVAIVAARATAAPPCTQEDRSGCAARCDGGDSIACELRGQSLASGRGATIDRPAAFEAYRRSCELGGSSGCGIAAALILRDIHDGVRPAIDTEKAARLLAVGCERGATQSCLKLAHLYAAGTEHVAPDPARATALFAEACARDDASACTELRAQVHTVTDDATRSLATTALADACRRRPGASYCR